MLVNCLLDRDGLFCPALSNVYRDTPEYVRAASIRYTDKPTESGPYYGSTQDFLQLGFYLGARSYFATFQENELGFSLKASMDPRHP